MAFHQCEFFYVFEDVLGWNRRSYNADRNNFYPLRDDSKCANGPFCSKETLTHKAGKYIQKSEKLKIDIIRMFEFLELKMEISIFF
jgi:hypothetical protein